MLFLAPPNPTTVPGGASSFIGVEVTRALVFTTHTFAVTGLEPTRHHNAADRAAQVTGEL